MLITPMLIAAAAAACHHGPEYARVRAAIEHLAPGRWTADREAHACALSDTNLPAGPGERAVLVALAHAETRFRRVGSDGTPAFGLLDWRNRMRGICARDAAEEPPELRRDALARCREWNPEIGESAWAALNSLRWWECVCAGFPRSHEGMRRCRASDRRAPGPDVVAAWETGTCAATGLSRAVWLRSRRVLAVMSGTPRRG